MTSKHGDELRPFLSTVTSQVQTTPLGKSLPAIDVASAPSPWTPKAAGTPMATAVDTKELEALRAEARERGRADGLRETEELRNQLAAAIRAFEEARIAIAPAAAELIADAATTAISAWHANAPATAMFRPVIESWVARTTDAATAKCHPSEVGALRELVGEAAITVVGDPAIVRGDIHVQSATLELDHVWTKRLGELREAIAAALQDS